LRKGKRILVTSALPYANGAVHLGHLAGAYLPADVFVRYQRAKKRDVVYICGSDEHGVPITIAAEKRGVTPQALVDQYRKDNLESFLKFGMSFDHYSGTSSGKHHEMAQEFFLKLHEKGYLSEKTISQFYCAHDKMYLADRYVEGECPHCHAPGARGDQCDSCGRSLDQIELIEPYCVICKNKPTIRETTHWFINLHDNQQAIKTWLGKKKNWKDNVKNFCYGLLKSGLEDRSITRDLKWGVQVPLKDYEDKVMYVWFDAPIGYISFTVEWANKIGDPEAWKKYWMDDDSELIHFLAKDNIVFHSIIWPLMLMGHGDYILPDEIPANEYLTLEGEKFSTSKDYAVWLNDYLKRFEPDPLRYCLAVNAPETKDSDFSWKDFQARNNNELADILGNFINRTLTFVAKNFEGRMPECGQLNDLDQQMLQKLNAAPARIGDLLEKFELRKAVTEFMDLARFANKYFNDATPWLTAKSDRDRCATTMHMCCRVCASLAVLMAPLIPYSAQKLWNILNQSGTVQECHWDEAADVLIEPGHVFNEIEILFNKIEDEVIEEEIAKLKRKLEGSKDTMSDKITFDDFKKVDLRVAKVLEAERVEKADKLLKLKIDLGNETRQIVAGIAKHYAPEDIIGKQIVVVANLEPATIRGVESNGMLLAASDKDSDSLTVVTLDTESKPGIRIS
jgi:methionyl-tRNA synthetase